MGKTFFGKTSAGETASTYTIANSEGMKALVTDFGATLISLFVKNGDGKVKDVVLGYDEVASYERERCYFGATVGRNANRIANAQFEIDGVTYQLEQNDNGNNLHSGSKGTAGRLWKVKSQDYNKITFVIEDADCEQGYPGNATMEVTYELTDDGELVIFYHCEADKKTVFNLTNHAYFNLNGHESGDVLLQELQLNASGYTPVIDGKAIPTGEIAPVAGTPFDFTQPKAIGKEIRADHEQIKYGNGYDHNFAVDKKTDGVELIGSAYAPESKIFMEVLTDLPGVQLYTGNFIGGQVGKGGVKYVNNGAFCLETQYFPNSVNEPNFEAPITDAGVPYETTTIYRFSVKA